MGEMPCHNETFITHQIHQLLQHHCPGDSYSLVLACLQRQLLQPITSLSGVRHKTTEAIDLLQHLKGYTGKSSLRPSKHRTVGSTGVVLLELQGIFCYLMEIPSHGCFAILWKSPLVSYLRKPLLDLWLDSR